MQIYCEFEENQKVKYSELTEKLEEHKKKEDILRNSLTPQEIATNDELKQLEGMIMALQTFAQELADTEELFDYSESNMAKQYKTGSKSNKVALCLDLIDEIIESGEKVAIFSKYQRMQDILTNHINKSFKDKDYPVKIAYINGSLNSAQRYVEAYDKFRDDDDYKILLLSDAGCEGLNLSKCKYLIEFDIADSYAIQTQRHGRIERSDSIHDNVFVYQLIVSDSWDEVQLKIVSKKESYDEDIIKSLA